MRGSRCSPKTGFCPLSARGTRNDLLRGSLYFKPVFSLSQDDACMTTTFAKHCGRILALRPSWQQCRTFIAPIRTDRLPWNIIVGDVLLLPCLCRMHVHMVMILFSESEGAQTARAALAVLGWMASPSIHPIEVCVPLNPRAPCLWCTYIVHMAAASSLSVQ